jgi:serine/threonine protein kinase
MVDKRVSHYDILERLGGGGMGVVYKAEDTRLHRTVALKFLPPAFSFDEEAKLRFIHEAQAASSLQHNNICNIHDIDETEDDRIFICMDFYEGETLKKKIERGPLEIEEAAHIITQIAEGLEKAHNKGIIHRDIKPANIFITKDGIVKILDFGLAKLSGQTMMTRTGATIGTAAYMSPEQVRGEEVDSRTDIWSLGVVLYEMITGKLPFKGEYEQAVIYSILNLPVQPICALKPYIDPKLEFLIMDCLIKDPNERWQTAGEISHRLKILKKSPNLLPGKSNKALEKFFKYSRLKNKFQKIFTKKNQLKYSIFIVLAGLFIGIVLSPIFFKESSIDLSKYKFTPIANDESLETSAEWSPDNKNIVYVKNVNGFDQLFIKSLNNPFPFQITTLKNENATRPFWSPDGNLIYFIKGKKLYSVGLTGGEPKKIIDSVYAATISPDGNTIAFYRIAKLNSSDSLSLNKYKRSVYIYSIKDSSLREYRPTPFELYGIFIPNIIHFSPDGKKVGLSIWGDEAKNVEFWILPWPDGNNNIPYKIFNDSRLSFPAYFSWFPDSRNIILSLMDRSVNNLSLGMADIESEEIINLLPAVSDEHYIGSLSPDGTKIALSKRVSKSNIISIPLDGSSPNYFLTTSLGEGCISFSSDGRRSTYLTVKNGIQEVWLRNRDEDIRPVVTSNDFKNIEEVSFPWATISPDGNLIALQVFGKNISPTIYIVPSTGGKPVRLLSGDYMEDIYTWSPDSKFLAIELSRKDKSYLAIVKVGAQEKPSLIQVLTKSAILESVLWSPDGKLISYHDGSQIIIITPDGKIKKIISSPEKDRKFRLVYAVWSKDSKSFYIVTFNGSESGVIRLYNLIIESKAYRFIAENKVDFNFNLHVCLAPDGKSLLASIDKTKSDIWLWEGFPQP